jgi:hypothetical protein
MAVQRGRKSAAALAVISPMEDWRPSAPDDLTDFQRSLWERLVASEPNDFFKGAGRQALLKDFCRHVEAADQLAKLIDAFRPEWLATDEGLDRYGKLLGLRERETRTINSAATKLRLTNQARYTPVGAARASAHVRTGPAPWEMRR